MGLSYFGLNNIYSQKDALYNIYKQHNVEDLNESLWPLDSLSLLGDTAAMYTWAASWQNQQNSLCAQRILRSAWASAHWSESSLSAWRNIGSSAAHWAHREDWSDWVYAQADLSLRWAQKPFCWFCHEMSQSFSDNFASCIRNKPHFWKPGWFVFILLWKRFHDVSFWR